MARSLIKPQMLETLLLLAAVSGGEAAAQSTPPSATIAEAPAIAGAASDAAANVRHAPANQRPWISDDPDLNAVISKISDFYDVTPPAKPAPPAKTTTTRPSLGPHLVQSSESYQSQGRQIRIDVLRPDDDEPRPAVLILHGASGIGDGTFYREAAEIFAERGYVTFIPYYLPKVQQQRSTHVSAKKGAKDKPVLPQVSKVDDESVRAGFAVQERTLRDALAYMTRSAHVDASRIGVFGMSLGGFHALHLSSQDYRIMAVVDMSGALRGNTMPESDRLPPTLALHGARDSLVPVSRARSLAEYLKRRGIPHELMIYPDQGHFFRGKAQADALQRSAAFFGTYLGQSDINRADTNRAARSRDGGE